MWISEKFGHGVRGFDASEVTKLIKETFDFKAPTDSEPTVATATDVLGWFMIGKNVKNARAMSEILQNLVGPSKMASYGGRKGRFFALPPRKADFL